MKRHDFLQYSTYFTAFTILFIFNIIFANHGSLEKGQFYKVHFKDKPMAIKALQLFEAESYEVSWEEKYHVMKLIPEAVEILEGLDFIVEQFPNYNMYNGKSQIHHTSNDTYDGIPDYPSYLTVEETFHYADSLTKVFPALAKWTDEGDSWEKIQGNGGYDHMVLILTNANIAGPKPKLFLGGAIHAREYTTSELNRRFVKYCIENYNKDADATWMLDYHELHVMFFINPDGRKHAESGKSWRKNTNTDYCKNNPRYRGVDLNRNADVSWSSGSDECSQTYPGSGAASEPEMKALQAYMDKIFKDNSNTGIYIDMHSYGEIFYLPSAMGTLVRKFSYFNKYDPQDIKGGLAYRYAYSEAGAAAACLFELGTSFFQNCNYFENTIVKDNLPALVYALKACRDPINIAQGPDAVELKISGKILTAKIDDTRYGHTVETQNIKEAEYYIEKPPWLAGATPIKMSASDGNFNSKIENVKATLPEDFPKSNEKTIIFVRGKDTNDKWGALSAIFTDAINNIHDTKKPLKTQAEFTISQNIQTPVYINLSVPQLTNISLKVYNVSGKTITTLISTKMKAGHHTIKWNCRDNRDQQLPGGVYMFQLVTDNYVQTKRFIMVK